MTEIEKKEIEEMAEVVIKQIPYDENKLTQDNEYAINLSLAIATALRNAHYRLESEVVKEFVKKCGKDFAIQFGVWGNEAQRNALDKAWKTINEVAEQYGAGEDK